MDRSCSIHRNASQKTLQRAKRTLRSERESQIFLEAMWEKGRKMLFEPERLRPKYRLMPMENGIAFRAFNQFWLIDQLIRRTKPAP